MNNQLNFRYKEESGKISVVLPCFKKSGALEVTLSSIEKQEIAPFTLEVIVANDGGDRRVTNAAYHARSASVVEIEPRQGSYYARNRAIEYSSGEYLIFLDDGMVLDAGWIMSGVRALNDADYICGNVNISNINPGNPAHLYQKYMLFKMDDLLKRHHAGGAGALIVRRSLIVKYGGFDERLISGGDMEFGNRLYHFGVKQSFLSTPFVYHSARSYSSLVKQQKRIEAGWNILTIKYPDRFSYRNPIKTRKNMCKAICLLLPPSIGNFYILFRDINSVQKIGVYFLMWRIRLIKPLYYLRSKIGYDSARNLSGQESKKVHVTHLKPENLPSEKPR